MLTGQLGQDVRDLKVRVLSLEEKVGSGGAHEAPEAYGLKPDEG